MEELTLDYLKNHPDYKLYQSKKMFRINTDTCLLGEYMKVNQGETLLDVGTNNGALLIYASKKTSNLIVGIDINLDALQIAKKNMELNSINNYHLLHCDFNEYQAKDKFDVIVSNPPYFNTKDDNSKNNNEYLKIARHEEFLKLDNLIKQIKINLVNDGRAYIVHRPDRIEDIRSSVKKYEMSLVNIRHVIDQRKNKEVTILVEIVNCKQEKIIEDTIYINGF